jgi:predicted RNA-binding Zn-ribbon protein involved in translation (DUF1610 family)
VDLERLFQQLVLNLAATDPARLRRPIPLADVRNTIVPYRTNRRALGIESNDDYELALMRLCAGESGWARTEPADVQAEFAGEVQSANPDLDLLQQRDQAVILLNPEAVSKVMDPKPDLRFAPSQSPIASDQKTPRKRAKTRPELPLAEERPLAGCTRCGGTLPVGRIVNFCPQCGHNLTRRHCAQCNSQIEASWKHCVSCGASASGTRNAG